MSDRDKKRGGHASARQGRGNSASVHEKAQVLLEGKGSRRAPGLQAEKKTKKTNRI